MNFDSLVKDEKYQEQLTLYGKEKLGVDFNLLPNEIEQRWLNLSEETREHYKLLGERRLFDEMFTKAKDDPAYMESIKEEAIKFRGNTPDEFIFSLKDGTEVFRIFRNADQKIDMHISHNGRDKYTRAVQVFMDIFMSTNLKRRNFTWAVAMQYMKQGFSVARFANDMPYSYKDNKLYKTEMGITVEIDGVDTKSLLASDFYVIPPKKNAYVTS